jgi:hypothetical protein
MKKLLLSTSFLFLLLSGFAQSEKYTSVMLQRLAAMDTTRSVDGLRELSAGFERIAEAEKTQWQPYYYAAYNQVQSGYFLTQGSISGGMATTLDPIADKAEQLLNKAEALSKDNSEIFIVKKMIASLRMMGDPMNRYMQFGPIAAEALQTAKALNPENPRIYLLEAQDKFFTPEQYGGSKTEAKKLFETALTKFGTFKPATQLDPNWGREAAEYFLSQIK